MGAALPAPHLDSPGRPSSDQCAPLLLLSSVPAQIWCWQLAVARCHVVGLVTGRGRRVLHDHQADGGLAGLRRHVVGRVLLGGVFAPAVVQDAGDEEDEEEDDVAGHQDDEVQGDGVDLQVELHETHGGRFISRQLTENAKISKEDGGKEQMTAMK